MSALRGELKELRASCLAMETEFRESIAQACPESRESVRNLLHYLALRKHDLRDVQTRLAALGLSSLGRLESGVLTGIDAVIAIVDALVAQHPFRPAPPPEGLDHRSGSDVLTAHAEDLLGPSPEGRAVRIMVTMPSEAARSYELVKSMVEAGMDVMRVNCAHDAADDWKCMIDHARRASQELGKPCKVLMDLAGPKLRTGAIHRGSRVMHWRVRRNVRGTVTSPARICLVSGHSGSEALPPCDAWLPVPHSLLLPARPGDILKLTDARGKNRTLTVTETANQASGQQCVCTCEKSAWVLSGAEVSLLRKGETIGTGHVGDLPFVEEPLRLRVGDILTLTPEAPPGDEASPPPSRRRHELQISCTLPEVFSTALPGQPIFFDDGMIGGRIREVHPDRIQVGITHAGDAGSRLGSAKGINLPETAFGIGALTAKDKLDLDFVAQHADLVGLSFVRRPEDVTELHRELAKHGNTRMGIVLKIESRPGFDHLPLIMLAALRQYPAGIMVARGDLAIEAGFERLAEIQEEILWLSEAAHMPVIWATQVLDTLARTGVPSRAEVTDAAMGVRAECVMLNKGPHILDAVTFLDHILHRMQDHHIKKRSMLRRLAVAQVSHVAGS